MKPSDLQPEEFAGHFATYINQVSSEYTLVEELEISVHRLIKFVQNIPLDKFDYRYAEGKWTIKDIIQHLIDAERIFGYRALRFARNDKTELPGFEENDYVDYANANQRSIQDLLTELAVVRQATLSLFKSFSNEDLHRIGIASHNLMSVRALGFTIIGHQNHHQRVFEERYLD
ncbi:DinB family protein [Flavobacterium sp.]|uniref:DinB family protein n=1 Tax=Flavobacterium sp. TaxID=239 RepID=UPI00286CA644|nr:DinB family protein [Flavobacterium sp.]